MGMYTSHKSVMIISNPNFKNSKLNLGLQKLVWNYRQSPYFRKKFDPEKVDTDPIDLGQNGYVVSEVSSEEWIGDKIDTFLSSYFSKDVFIEDLSGIEMEMVFKNDDGRGNYWRYKYHNTRDYCFYSKIRFTDDLTFKYILKCIIKQNEESAYTKIIKQHPPAEVVDEIFNRTKNINNLKWYLEKEIPKEIPPGKGYFEVEEWRKQDTSDGVEIDFYEDFDNEFNSRESEFLNRKWEDSIPFVNTSIGKSENLQLLVDQIHETDPCSNVCWHLKDYYKRLSFEFASQANDPFIFLVSYYFAKDLQSNLRLNSELEIMSKIKW